MTLQTICSVDFQALNKRDLKALCQAARDEWGQPIDLRSGAAAMIAYLEEYKQWKLDQELAKVEEVTEETAVTPTENAEIEIVNDAPSLSDFEGITIEEMPGEWWSSCPLSCDVCNFQSCEIPQHLPLELFDGIDIHPMISPEDTRYLASPLTCDIGEWLDALNLQAYWASWTRTYNACVAKMKATRLGQLLKDEYEAECRDWWANWEQKYQESIATMKATKIEPLSTSICVIENSPVIVALWILVAIALMLDAAVWIVRKAQDTQLIQKGFKAAVGLVQRKLPNLRIFTHPKSVLVRQ
ncbi:MAG: hypothetical protein C6Y22_30370 [Hapalosiphonaceae cyanobacterium JJU2]|nr:MAG: hypothetical protein C6Y22_30370 [Hapalosiphonaceae cyanobacterium JJU2]